MFNVGDKVKLSLKFAELGYEFDPDDVYTVLGERESRILINAALKGRRIIVHEGMTAIEAATVRSDMLVLTHARTRGPIDSML